MSKDRNKDAFIAQAGILAAAGIIVRIIGILYRSPLTSIIGDEGNGYYSTAYNIYAIILLLSSYSIPAAISKVIAQRLATREYRNAHRIFRCAMIYVIVVGGAASLLTFLLAPILVDVNSVPVLRVFAPTIFLSGILGVLRGYFQAHGTMVHTSISQVLEQILNAVVSILGAWILIRLAASASTSTQAIRGAMGSALGTGIGVATALLFMYALYRLNRGFFARRVARDRTRGVLSDKDIFKLIFLMVTPFILSTFIYNFSTSLDQTIYIRIMRSLKGYSSADAATAYGIYAGKAVVILNIPIALAASMSSAMIPAISGTFARNDRKGTRQEVAAAVQMTMLIAIPATVGLAVLARPVTQLLFPQKASLDMASALLRAQSISIIFYCLSTLTNAVLQGIGRVNQPVINAGVALVLQTVVLVPLLLFTNIDQYAMVIAAIVYSFLMCVLNQVAVRRSLRYRQEFLKTFFLPLLASAVMGVAAWGSYRAVYSLIKINAIALILSIVIAIAVYFVLVIKTGAMGEQEMRRLPGGGSLVNMSRRLRLL